MFVRLFVSRPVNFGLLPKRRFKCGECQAGKYMTEGSPCSTLTLFVAGYWEVIKRSSNTQMIGKGKEKKLYISPDLLRFLHDLPLPLAMPYPIVARTIVRVQDRSGDKGDAY